MSTRASVLAAQELISIVKSSSGVARRLKSWFEPKSRRVELLIIQLWTPRHVTLHNVSINIS